jgi:hypothetical protein
VLRSAEVLAERTPRTTTWVSWMIWPTSPFDVGADRALRQHEQRHTGGVGWLSPSSSKSSCRAQPLRPLDRPPYWSASRLQLQPRREASYLGGNRGPDGQSYAVTLHAGRTRGTPPRMASTRPPTAITGRSGPTGSTSSGTAPPGRP